MSTFKKFFISDIGLIIALTIFMGTSFAYLYTNKTHEPLNTNIRNLEISNIELSATPEQNSDIIKLNDGSLKNLNPGDNIPISYDIINHGNTNILTKSSVYFIFNDENLINDIKLVGENNEEIKGIEGEYNLNGQKFKSIKYSSDIFNLSKKDNNNPKTEEFTKTFNYKIQFNENASINTMNKKMTIKTYTGAIQSENTSDDDILKISEDPNFTPKNSNGGVNNG